MTTREASAILKWTLGILAILGSVVTVVGAVLSKADAEDIQTIDAKVQSLEVWRAGHESGTREVLRSIDIRLRRIEKRLGIAE